MNKNKEYAEMAHKANQEGKILVEVDGVLLLKDPPEKPIDVQIMELKTELSATDYRIDKCAEYKMVGKELPYNIEYLHEEREKLRKQINDLENEQKIAGADSSNGIGS